MEMLIHPTPAVIQRSSGIRAYVAHAFQQCWSGSASLTAVATLMIPAALGSIAGLWLDPTTVTNAPTWMKPLKFAISIGLFSYTVAFMIGQLHRTRRLSRWLGRILAFSLLVELILIDLQAARHTSSHFNFTTRFDAMVFATMGCFISLVLLSTILLLIVACYENFRDPALAWTIRLSLFLALAGMSTGILMTLPTPEQLAVANAGLRTGIVGAHTVGAPDGGATTPLLGWSADHGDLRIAHFVGLHAMQLLLLGWGLTASGASWPQRRRVQMIALIASSIALAYAALLIQALRGQPLFRIDTVTSETWAIWLIYTLIVVFWIRKASVRELQEQIPEQRPETAAPARARSTRPCSSGQQENS